MKKKEVTVKEKKVIDIKTLHVSAGVRYWEDASVNGIEDTDGSLIPFKEGELWKPIIDVENGVILNWPKDTIANIHYKVCDAGSYFLKDAEGNTVASIEDDYVPEMLTPTDNGYGDYIILDVDADGNIDGWKADFKDFFPDEDED